ncbi:MAG: hypothetical protein ABH857_01000 [Elusimicrobiota bacterium]
MKKIEARIRPYLTRLIISLIPSGKQISAEEIRNSTIRRILIVYPHNETGDMLLATPMIKALKELIGAGGELGVVVRPLHCAVLINNPDIDEIYVYDKKKLKVFGLLKFIKKIRSRRYDAAIVIDSISFSLTSGLFAYFSNARYVIGARDLAVRFEPKITRLFNLMIPINFKQHDILIKCEYAAFFKAVCNDLSERMILTKDEECFYEDYYKNNNINSKDKVIIMHLGAGKAQNRWAVKILRRLEKKYWIRKI